MQFSITSLLPVAALFAAAANAAECYSQHGSTACLDRNDLMTARAKYCGGTDWKSSETEGFQGSNGMIGSFTGSNIPNQQSCWDSTLNIIDTCLGHKDGGQYSLDGWKVNINFCVQWA